MTMPATKGAAPALPPSQGPKEERPLARLWKRLRRSRTAVFGLGVVLSFLILAIFAQQIAPYGPDQADFAMALKGPSAAHLFGNDELGRDLLTRMLYGARISVLIGVISVSIGLLIGVPLGLIAGYYGGWVDMVISRVVEVMLAFPSILLAIFLSTFLNPVLSQFTALSGLIPPGLTSAMVGVGLVSVPTYARLVRGSTLAVREEDYIAAAVAAGSRDLRILWRHVLPNVVAPILVQSSLQTAAAILSAAALGFLGLGAPPNVPEWGTMLQKSRTYVFSAPHLMTYPGLAIMLVVLGFNLLGDGLRDALDPRLKH